MVVHQKLDYSDFLKRFFAECGKQFCVLEDMGFHQICGLAYYQNMHQIIEPFSDQKIDPPFTAVCSYEKQEITLEIKYESADYRLETWLYYQRIHPLSWQELINPLAPFDGTVDPQYRIYLSSLTMKISEYHNLLHANIAILTDPDPRRIDKALKKKAKRIEQYLRKTYRENLDAACVKAAKVFAMRDYREVIELLTPYKKDLRGAELKKLAIAKKRFLGQV
jgi:hypothetical protein